MRILHVITSLRTGGAEKLMVDLIPRLKAAGHDVDLLIFDGTDTPFRREAEAAGIKVIDFGEGASVYDPRHILRLRRLMKSYDALHAHNTSPQLFSAIAAIGRHSHIKLITTEHNSNNRKRSWPGYRLIDRWMYNRFDSIICISKIAEDNLRQYLGSCRAQILTINNGVDVNRYASATPTQELEAIAPGSRKLIMVAGFRIEKDQDTIIRALPILPDDFHLFLVGDGVRRPELEALAKTEDVAPRVHLLGVRSDVPALLHSADYVIMSSHHEGLSLSSVEGMSVGKPFLASDVDGLRQVVEGAGILFPHADAKALAEAIKSLDADKAEYDRVATACLDRARRFDITSMAEQYSRIYQSLEK